MEDHGRLTAVHISKHSCVWRVCNVCVLVLMLVCAVVYVLRVWDVRFVFRCCGVYVVLSCVVVLCGLPCGNLSVCRFKTPPCVRSRRLVCTGKRPHVFEHNKNAENRTAGDNLSSLQHATSGRAKELVKQGLSDRNGMIAFGRTRERFGKTAGVAKLSDVYSVPVDIP